MRCKVLDQKPHRIRFFAVGLATALCVTGCRHYDDAYSDREVDRIAIGLISNLTHEPRLGSYVKQELPALFDLERSVAVAATEEADHVLSVVIRNYELNAIGEERIESADDDQRTYRSSVFEVRVDLEYTVTPVTTSKQSEPITKHVTGFADFSELVDIDIVRRDGLRRAIHDACGAIVSSVAHPW